ncbi:MAG: epimerase [Erythrobacter sp. RIFCSPHIGHO2_12_FULL_63_10]|nr:MAG: epimerase [Erythrobacter sp. RIFCSPHIGHO2_12_FULL_63_10]
MTSGAPLAITGGTGFVGQALLDRVRPTASRLEDERDAYHVRALTRREQEQREGVEWVAGSLADESALATLAQGAAALIHIAGLTNTPDPANFEAANVTGTANVVAAAKEARVKRLVFVSSLAAREPTLSRYGASKAQAEELVKASGLDWTIVRPPAVYGPRDTEMFELFRAARLGIVPLPPGGATSIIHVDDLARLLLRLVGPSSSAAVGTTRHKIFEPDDGREGGWSHKELAHAIGQSVGRKIIAPHLPRAALRGAAGIDRLLRGDRAKLTSDRVGYMCHPNWVARFDRQVPEALWSPQIGGEAGLAATVEWYRSAGWL